MIRLSAALSVTSFRPPAFSRNEHSMIQSSTSGSIRLLFLLSLALSGCFAPEVGLEITRTEGGRLSLTLPGFTATLTPVGPLTFFAREAKFVFVADETGEITGLRIHDEESTQTLEKVR